MERSEGKDDEIANQESLSSQLVPLDRLPLERAAQNLGDTTDLAQWLLDQWVKIQGLLIQEAFDRKDSKEFPDPQP